MIKVGRLFGLIAVGIAVVIVIGIVVVIVIGIVVGKDSFFPPEDAPGSTAAILVFAGLAFFFSAGLAVWCLPPSGCDCGKTQENPSSGSAPGTGASGNPEPPH